MSEPTFTIPDELREALRGARHVAVLTGAGISAESGIPTFRDAQTGLWARYRPEELATPEAFRQNPKLVWDWYAWRRKLCAQAAPNAGHLALVELARRVPRLSLITQNVDGLHARAGSPELIELHGSIDRVKCSREGKVAERWEEAEGATEAPRCACGAFLRPDVVWFGEALPQGALRAAQEAAARCDLFFSVGTSSVVEPAASLPYLALERGAGVVELNPQRTPLSESARYVLAASAAAALPALLRAAWPEP